MCSVFHLLLSVLLPKQLIHLFCSVEAFNNSSLYISPDFKLTSFSALLHFSPLSWCSGSLSPARFCVCGQVQHFGSGPQEWNGNYAPRRQQAFLPATVAGHAFSLPQGSPSHGSVHAHLSGSSHLGGQPAILPYASSAPLSTAAPVAHLLASPCTSRPLLQHPTYNLTHPSGIVHQVPVGINPRLLPSPTIHQTQYKPIFPPHSYIAASPAAYTGFPLSPTKLSQYPFM